MSAVEHVPATPPTPAASLLPLREAIAGLARQADQLAVAGDLNTLAYGLDQLGPILADLRQLKSEIEGHVADLMPTKKVEVPGVGVLERRKGTDRKQWQTADLTAHLVRCALVDPETGEMPGTVSEGVERVVGVLTKAAPFTPSMAWRVGALRELGVEVDEWATCTPGRVTVTIHGGEK